MRRAIYLLFLAGCTPNAGTPSLYSKVPVTSGPLTDATCELIDAELRWGRHLQQARRCLDEGRFSDAEQELWLAELSLFGVDGTTFLAEQTRASRLQLRQKGVMTLVGCGGDRVTVQRAR